MWGLFGSLGSNHRGKIDGAEATRGHVRCRGSGELGVCWGGEGNRTHSKLLCVPESSKKNDDDLEQTGDFLS